MSSKIFTEDSECQINEAFKFTHYNQTGKESYFELLPTTFEVKARKRLEVRATMTNFQKYN